MKRFIVKTFVDTKLEASALIEDGQVASAVKSLLSSVPANSSIVIYSDGYTSVVDQLKDQVSTLQRKVRSLEKAGEAAEKKTAARKKKAD